MLIPIINWSFHDVGFLGAIEANWADLRRVPLLRRLDLRTKILTAIELFPCEMVLVHRGAEREPRESRVSEIAAASPSNPITVPVVPVRMTEAWLLNDVNAIRQAAGNPNGDQPLSLPRPEEVEQIPDPKQVLFDTLRSACGLNTLRRAKLNVAERTHRIAELTTDFSPLRRLTAFAAFQDDLRRALTMIRGQ